VAAAEPEAELLVEGELVPELGLPPGVELGAALTVLLAPAEA
jgi:hypothetical protein